MKKYKAIFFDLDGTLLPMDLNEFMGAYYKELCLSLVKYGLGEEKIMAAMREGVMAMIYNDGSELNCNKFWQQFLKNTGIPEDTIYEETEYFYSHEFHKARAVTGENPLARAAIEAAGLDGRTVVLSTNPLFPYTAQLSRISWIGLKEEDFALITSYENSSFCKPNPKYFLEICKKLSLDPGEGLLIGNDVRDDMLAAQGAGIDGYLVTNWAIYRGKEWNGPQGTFSDMIDMLKAL